MRATYLRVLFLLLIPVIAISQDWEYDFDDTLDPRLHPDQIEWESIEATQAIHVLDASSFWNINFQADIVGSRIVRPSAYIVLPATPTAWADHGLLPNDFVQLSTQNVSGVTHYIKYQLIGSSTDAADLQWMRAAPLSTPTPIRFNAGYGLDVSSDVDDVTYAANTPTVTWTPSITPTPTPTLIFNTSGSIVITQSIGEATFEVAGASGGSVVQPTATPFPDLVVEQEILGTVDGSNVVFYTAHEIYNPSDAQIQLYVQDRPSRFLGPPVHADHYAVGVTNTITFVTAPISVDPYDGSGMAVRIYATYQTP